MWTNSACCGKVLTLPQQAEIVYEPMYLDFKEFDKVKSWTRSVTFRAGRKIVEYQVVEAKFRDRLPAGTFDKP
jgi:hypothetical protein